MLFSSVVGTPLSVSSSVTAYRLMIQRVNSVATNFDPFSKLSVRTQTALLKHNSDLLVSLRAAVFFETNMQGLDQIVITLGISDCDFAHKLVSDAKNQWINKINYRAMNPIQKIEDSSPLEQR